EIYPSLLKMPGKDQILDREQVRTYVKWLQQEQIAGRLESWLAGPKDLSKKERKRVIRHEGWVLGVE
ncbi:MAG: cobalamin biosynthesis protein CbiG, partial [Bacteroidota bacterium]